MAEATKDNNATPPATSGGLTKEDVQAIIAGAIAPLVENQKILADTLAKLPPATADKKEGEAPKPLSADDVKAQIAEALKAARETDASAAAKKAARQAVIDAKLKGVPEEFLAGLPDTDDAKALEDAAGKIRERVLGLKIALPDVGGAGKDGGTKPGEGQPPAKPNFSLLSEGTQKYADSIKLPGKTE